MHDMPLCYRGMVKISVENSFRNKGYTYMKKCQTLQTSQWEKLNDSEKSKGKWPKIIINDFFLMF